MFYDYNFCGEFEYNRIILLLNLENFRWMNGVVCKVLLKGCIVIMVNK